MNFPIDSWKILKMLITAPLQLLHESHTQAFQCVYIFFFFLAFKHFPHSSAGGQNSYHSSA